MPSYTMINRNTKEEKTLICSWTESLLFLEENKDYDRILSTSRIVSGIGQVQSKTPDGFRDVLKQMSKKAGKGNKVRY